MPNDFQITNVDRAFYEKLSPVFNGKKYLIPEPTLCPQCRQQRRFSWRNERHLYRRHCDLTGKPMISCFPPDAPFTVYHFKEWNSDSWDPLDYGRDFDFNRPFFEQFDELLRDVPKKNLEISDNMENCDYCNYGADAKNCYLCVSPVDSQDCLYSWTPYQCTRDVDCHANMASQYCYEGIILENCYQVHYSQYSKNCSNSWFLQDCISCKNCFGCINLQQKEYYFLNEQLSETEYHRRVNEIVGSYEQLEQFKKSYRNFLLTQPHKAVRNFHTEDSSGDLLRQTKNCHQCFDLIDMENSKYNQ